MKKNFLYLITIVLLLSACTSQPITMSTNQVSKVVADITVTLNYIGEKELIKLHKKEGNVFANYPGRFPPKKSVVFQLDISTEESVLHLNTDELFLKIGEISDSAITQDQLLRAWSTYISKPIEEGKAKKMVRMRMLDDEIMVSPDNPVSGWIVFLENYPDDGEAIMTLNMSTENGDSGAIEIPLDFTIDATTDRTPFAKKEEPEETEKENSGIFAE